MIVCIVVCTGMRISEILGLKWSDIDFKGTTIRIVRIMDGKHENLTKAEESQVEEYPLHDPVLSRPTSWRKLAKIQDLGFDQSHHRPSVPPEHALRGSPETRLEAGSGFGRGLAYFQTHVSATLADLGEELETQKALMRHRTSP